MARRPDSSKDSPLLAWPTKGFVEALDRPARDEPLHLADHASAWRGFSKGVRQVSAAATDPPLGTGRQARVGALRHGEGYRVTDRGLVGDMPAIAEKYSD